MNTLTVRKVAIEKTTVFAPLFVVAVNADVPHRKDVAPTSRTSDIEVGDFIYSAARDFVGVVRGVDAVHGFVDIYLGTGILRFFAVAGNRLVRPNWCQHSLVYSWESVEVLRDERSSRRYPNV